MNYISRAIIRMGIFIGFAVIAVSLLRNPLLQAFSHNMILNSVIFSILGVGVFTAFYNLFRIYKEQQWLKSFDRGHEHFPGTPLPEILMPIALIFNESRNQYLSPILVRSLLASVESRLDAMRDVTRYVVGLLIFMGLLGTFWGLSQTIGAIAGVISGIDFGGAEVKEAFTTLKQGLQSPLSGMGTAFSCSMFGLAGSLAVGFLDLQIGRMCTDFYHGVEDRLTLLTKVASVDGSDSSSGMAYVQGLLEQTVENMNQLQNLTRRGEENRASVVKSVQLVGEKLSMLGEQMTSHQQFLKRITESQVELQEVLRQFYQSQQESLQDDVVKKHLRNLDISLGKLLEESIEGRARTTQELRNEIRLVARTISALASGQDAAA